ncbi:hypothetical protein IAW_05017 [Bacillus cereus str. Schrouff]|uniref:hypothetical protein n=1 Tax=Bacillus cereus TaxID=1396 RepID=UPI00032E341B|nr:hypothetical protein [Bacillus cereus]EOO05708.1 hypothetical protein IAW_05017 [Bacillus cereus str. Schrouff]EOO81850.1 hypothetical protein IGY_05561 [Bacillus cereus K-5975c]MCU4896385.1 hypothetical protein [Bacillus cereus]
MGFYKRMKTEKTTVTNADGTKVEVDKSVTNEWGGIATIVLSVAIGIMLMMHPKYLADTVVHLKGLLKK